MKWFSELSRQQKTFFGTLAVAILLFLAASVRYTGFASTGVLINLLDDNAVLGIAAVGMTFVILSGGIDLSVGAMIGFTSIATALLVERAQLHPAAVLPLMVAGGALFGAVMGALVGVFELAPFLVTLAGMFFLRGLAFTLSLDSVPLAHPWFAQLSQVRFSLGVPFTTILMLAVMAAGAYLAAFTRFGRAVYAIGGSGQSALLMGIPMVRSQVAVYAMSGATSALAGVAFAIYTSSGNATAATGFELDVIAAVVIGGTLLTGGSGTIFGTLLGTLILGMIQTMITFEGTLSSWWARIATGALLLLFVGGHNLPWPMVYRGNKKAGALS